MQSGKLLYSGNRGAYKKRSYLSSVRPRAGGRTFGRSDLARKVKIHITNLATSLTSADLSELFDKYAIESITICHDEEGEPIGAADVVTDVVSAGEIISSFKGVAMDGLILHMFIIDENKDRTPWAYDNERFKCKPYLRNGRPLISRLGRAYYQASFLLFLQLATIL
ncbi:unnamed protein product [Toxocara canis]|uniref:RRM domain-containing protein n=1 Tax=Toxocara canis TaxID=6265 RepID=A0A183TVR8_TOXCA|nr:unnamed protein product [Toxocara canis]